MKTIKRMMDHLYWADERILEALEESNLDAIIDYANQSGVPFRTSIRDILSQVILHGQYHRGQINRALRIESAEPVQVRLHHLRTTLNGWGESSTLLCQ